MNKKLNNIFTKFNLPEFSGAVGDLGTLLPLLFALVVVNGFPPERLFLLFGIVYVFTGLYFKVPVSVQPLKAMAVIAIAKGFSIEMLSITAFFYGVLLLFLSLTGIIKYLQKVFTAGLIRGVQLGIGLILAQKAVELVIEKGILLNFSGSSLTVNIILLIAATAVITLFQFRKKIPAALILIFLSIIFFNLSGYSPGIYSSHDHLISFTLPDFSKLLDAFIFLIIPQLPLTLGNAVYAANDICHTLWTDKAERVSAPKLGFSIGLSDTIIGLLGGFPICHGAGGMAAHAQFGAKSGKATIIIGSIFIFLALAGFSSFLFFIPVPLLAAMLLFDSYRMSILVKKIRDNIQLVTALLVGIISFATKNLSIALGVGIIFEYGYRFIVNKKVVSLKVFNND
jgi:sulfate permease, SulP family